MISVENCDTHKNDPRVYFKRVADGAIIPTRGTPNSVGWDLYALKDTPVREFTMTPIPTGIAVQPPPGCYAQVAARSGQTLKTSMMVGAGVIDLDYVDGLAVIMMSPRQTIVKAGTKIAQLLILRCSYVDSEVVDEFPVKYNSDHKGFGSTDV